MNKLKMTDWFLILIISFSALTELRIWKIGPTELLMLFWIIMVSVKFRFKIPSNFIMKFWYIFLVCLILGYFNRNLINRESLFILDETLSFITFFIFIIGLSIYFQNTTKKLIALVLINSYFISFSIYIILFAISLYTESIFGYTVYYGERFSPLANNPHQFIYLSGIMIFLSLYATDYLKINRMFKIIHIISILLYLTIMLYAESATFYLAFMSSLLIGSFYFIIKKFKIEINLVLSLVFFTLFIIVINIESIINFIVSYFHSDSNGLYRVNLWIDGIFVFLNQTNLIGLGPGAHISTYNHLDFMEAHQTFIDIGLRAGVIGLFAYIYLLCRLFQLSTKHFWLVSIVVFIFVYGLSGFTIRRVILWVSAFVIYKFGRKKLK